MLPSALISKYDVWHECLLQCFVVWLSYCSYRTRMKHYCSAVSRALMMFIRHEGAKTDGSNAFQSITRHFENS